MNRFIKVALLMVLASAAFAGLTFSPGGLGGGLEWDPVEGDYQHLVIKGSPSEFDADDPDWGVELGTVYPDEETGEFPTSYIISPSFVVQPPDCISCQLCIAQCPVDAIEMNTEGVAVIDAELCISCGLCASACPTDAIFAPSSSTHFVLFGVDAEGELAPIQEMEE